MSYLFTGSSAYLAGTLGTSITLTSNGLTIAAWVKAPTYPSNAPVASVYSSGTNFTALKASSTSNYWRGETYNGSVSRTATVVDDISADGWVPLLIVFESNGTNRMVYCDGVAGTDNQAGSASSLGSALTTLRIGDDSRGLAWLGSDTKVAAVAVWDKALSTEERQSYEAGDYPGDIAAANLRCYYSLFTDATKTDGADSIGTLSVTNATVDADNPPVSEGLVKYLKLLAHSSASGSTGVEGWVVDADNTTYYGKFTGEQFDAGTGGDSGYAVLKVALTEFGGTALTTSDTPQVVVRNSSFGTTMCDATVIEE